MKELKNTPFLGVIMHAIVPLISKEQKIIFYGNEGYGYINNCAKAQVPSILGYLLIL